MVVLVVEEFEVTAVAEVVVDVGTTAGVVALGTDTDVESDEIAELDDNCDSESRLLLLNSVVHHRAYASHTG